MNWSYVLERNADLFPEKEAIIFEEKRITYKALNERVNALASALLELGVRRGDIVAILLTNCSEYMELGFAANKIGAVWLPLNFRLIGEDFRYILSNSEAKLIFSEKEFIETINSISQDLEHLKTFISVGQEEEQGWINYNQLIDENMGKSVDHADVELDDLHRLMYTSGTTANPKGVMLTYGNLYWKNIGHILIATLTPEDKALIVGPLYHVGGMDLPASSLLYVGGSIVILKRFDPIKALETIEKEKATCTWFAPVMINMLFQERDFDKYDVSSMRFIIDGGEKMPLPLIMKVKEKFPNAWFADAYGLTETVSGDTFLDKIKMTDKIGSVGKPVAQLRVRIVDEQDNDVPPGQLGEIVLRGPKVFKGYWKNPEATAEALRNGWFHTGDIGYLDDDGFLYIEDRKKDIIISGGENISSQEVERVIYGSPKVLEVAVVAVPHPKWLEVPKAYVVLREGEAMEAEEIMELCAQKLAKFKVPKEVEFIDALPRNPSGKVLKRELRDKS
jgi:fatty-acyl-CoA synthase